MTADEISAHWITGSAAAAILGHKPSGLWWHRQKQRVRFVLLQPATYLYSKADIQALAQARTEKKP